MRVTKCIHYAHAAMIFKGHHGIENTLMAARKSRIYKMFKITHTQTRNVREVDLASFWYNVALQYFSHPGSGTPGSQFSSSGVILEPDPRHEGKVTSVGRYLRLRFRKQVVEKKCINFKELTRVICARCEVCWWNC